MNPTPTTPSPRRSWRTPQRRCTGWSTSCPTSACRSTRSGAKTAAWPSICCRATAGARKSRSDMPTGSSRSISSSPSTPTASRCGCVSASPTAPCSATSATRSATTTRHILVETGAGAARYLDECRELFGDERADYQAEIARHYKFGPPEGWQRVVHLRVRHHASMGGLRGVLRALSAHHRHHRHRPRSGPGACTPTRCASRLRGTSLRWSPMTTSPSSACSSTGNGCRCSSTA